MPKLTAPPASIGRYEIAGRIAVGDRAELFLGREPGGRPVAIKRLPPAAGRGSAARHPNLVEVYELIQDGGVVYVVEEYIEGENLAGVIRRLVKRGESLPYDLVANVMAQVCDGLHAGHQAGELHRAVAPELIYVTYRGGVKLLDFGIAVPRPDSPYRSPEQLGQRPLNRESDVYSAGIVLYELATQRRALAAGSPGATIPPPSTQVLDFPAGLEAVCNRALAREPSRRYRSAADMRDALYEAARELGGTDESRSLAAALVPLFRDRIARKRELLDRVRVGLRLDEAIPAEVDVDVEVPVVMHPKPRIPVTPAPRMREVVIGAPEPLAPGQRPSGPIMRTQAISPAAPMQVAPGQLESAARAAITVPAPTSPPEPLASAPSGSIPPSDAGVQRAMPAQTASIPDSAGASHVTGIRDAVQPRGRGTEYIRAQAERPGARRGVIFLYLLAAVLGGAAGWYLRVYGAPF